MRHNTPGWSLPRCRFIEFVLYCIGDWAIVSRNSVRL